MITERSLPPEFLEFIGSLEAAYLTHDDPILQSGFHGGAERWRAERSPILAGIEESGDLLDICCANGYLLACLVQWAKERSILIEPYGVDIGLRLIRLARLRFPGREDHFRVANVWDWVPSRRFRYVYTLYDVVPAGYLAEYVERLLARVVAPGGRLIVGAYGSRSQGIPAFDVSGFLRENGFDVAGMAVGGDPPLTAFAWVDGPQ